MATWSEIRAELDRLLELTEEERQARLERISERDPGLACELDSLLAHDRAAEHAPGFLARQDSAAPRDSGEGAGRDPEAPETPVWRFGRG